MRSIQAWMSRSNSFSTGPDGGQHLLWIQQRIGIEAVPQAAHDFQFGIGKESAHQILLLHSNSVFTRYGTTDADTEFEDLATCLECAPRLIRIASVKQDQRVQVSVARVKDVSDGERVLFADLVDLAQSFRN